MRKLAFNEIELVAGGLLPEVPVPGRRIKDENLVDPFGTGFNAHDIYGDEGGNNFGQTGGGIDFELPPDVDALLEQEKQFIKWFEDRLKTVNAMSAEERKVAADQYRSIAAMIVADAAVYSELWGENLYRVTLEFFDMLASETENGTLDRSDFDYPFGGGG